MMSFWRILTLFVSVFVLSYGCTTLYVQSPAHYGTTYDVWIDSLDISDEEEARLFNLNVERAVEEWNRAVPGLRMTWKARRCDEYPVPDHVICVFDMDTERLERMGCPKGSVGCTTRLSLKDSAFSAMDPSLVSKDVLRLVAMHELGHALGLKHETLEWKDRSVMTPFCNLESAHVTCRDLHQFWKLRGIERSCIF